MSEPRVLFLVRHGRSDFDSNEMTDTPRGKQFDPPLSEQGREQAELLAKRLLLGEPPAAVYCSPLRRARETVAPYAQRVGIDVRFDDDLVEANIGAWENKSFEEILESDERILHHLRNQQPIWWYAPGAEELQAFRKRVGEAVERILERHPAGNVLVVCHGGVINAFIAPLLGLPQEMFFLPENTSINSVVIDGGERRLRFLNDVMHLSDPHLFEA
jgi:probable phosphoglycerate mutase